MNCPCGSAKSYESCCGPFHEGTEIAETPEALMRSRYAAFALKKTDYLKETTDPQTRHLFDHAATVKWAQETEFTGLEVLSSSIDGNKGFVEFKAMFRSAEGEGIHHEKSRFRRQGGEWFYREGRTV